jgi:NADH:ubiquinone oxidoreductase subunit 4 (subunit M)
MLLRRAFWYWQFAAALVLPFWLLTGYAIWGAGTAGFLGVAILAPLTVVATLGLVITAVFLLTIVQKVWWSPVNAKWSTPPTAMADLTLRERVIACVFLAFIVVGGVCPGPFAAMANATVMKLVSTIGGAR